MYGICLGVKGKVSGVSDGVGWWGGGSRGIGGLGGRGRIGMGMGDDIFFWE